MFEEIYARNCWWRNVADAEI